MIRLVLSTLLLWALLSSCVNEVKEQNIPDAVQSSETVTPIANTFEKEFQDYYGSVERGEKLFNSLDSIQSVVELWNEAINASDFKLMEQLYAEKIQFYTTKLSRSEVIQSKREWLKKHANYKQKIELDEVQYPSENSDIIRCIFRKHFALSGEQKEVNGILELTYLKGEYVIIKESDRVTEMLVIKKTPPSSLSEGSYSFQHDYWLDTREHEALGHDFVPYNIGVSIQLTDTLKVDLTSYSGGLRETRDYITKDATLENGFISFRAAPIFLGENDPEDYSWIKEADYHFYKFKVFDGTIALVETDGWFTEMIGSYFWTLK